MAEQRDLVLDRLSRNVVRIKVDVDWLTSLTGYTGKMQVRDMRESGTVLADLSSHLTVDAVAGTVTLDLPADPSGDWSWRNGFYDIKVGPPASPELDVRILQGRITLDKEVTE